jgi:hypothetical protein
MVYCDSVPSPCEYEDSTTLEVTALSAPKNGMRIVSVFALFKNADGMVGNENSDIIGEAAVLLRGMERPDIARDFCIFEE